MTNPPKGYVSVEHALSMLRYHERIEEDRCIVATRVLKTGKPELAGYMQMATGPVEIWLRPMPID